MKTAAKPRRTAAAGRRTGQSGKGGARPAKSSAPAKRPGKSAPARAGTAPRRWSFPTLKLGAELRRDIVAVALVVLALLILWSLFGERGGLLGLWGDALRR